MPALRDLPPAALGLATCAALVVANLAVGEAFPFSRFRMYAGLGDRDHAALPHFELDGAPVDPLSLAAFRGIDPDHLVPPVVATSREHKLAAIRRHVVAHPAPDDAPEAAAGHLSLIWTLYQLDDGALRTERRVGQEGLAWRAAP